MTHRSVLCLASCFLLLLPLLLAGCGRYDDDYYLERIEVPVGTTAGGTTVTTTTTPVIIVPMHAAAPAPAPVEIAQRVQVTPVAPVVVPGGAVTCSGADQIVVRNRRIEAGDAPAIVASGSCRVLVDEAIVTGTPAIYATGSARVELVESRIRGDIVADGAARVTQSGVEHRGSIAATGAARIL